MAAGLGKRVARLERAGGRPCPACGGGGRGPVAYEVVPPEAVATLPPCAKARPPERCRNCGRCTKFWVTMAAPRDAEG